MRIQGKHIRDVTSDDLQSLNEAQVPESRTIEYKAVLPGRADQDKKEFLADASSFANTSGGVILYGITTKREGNSDTGIPEEITGVGAVNFGEEQRRLNQLLHAGLEPSLASQFEIREVPVDGAVGPVVLLGLRQSFVGPHRVTFQGSGKFWRRGEALKYEPDTRELRRMFLEPKAWLTEANEFRRSRIMSVAREEILGPVSQDLMYFIHVLPLGRLDSMMDPVAIQERLQDLGPLDHGSGWSPRPNADGLLVYNHVGNNEAKKIRSYSQWFRFGGVEGFTSTNTSEQRWDTTPIKVVWGRLITEGTRTYVRGVIAKMRDVLAAEPPLAVGLSLSGVKGAYLIEQWPAMDLARPFDRDRIDVPFVFIEDLTKDPKAELQPALDMIWQAGGHSRSP